MTVDRDFFLSFTGADRPWATWLLAELDAAGYSSVSQLRDFVAGSNFAVEMDQAARRARRTLGVLSAKRLRRPMCGRSGCSGWPPTPPANSIPWCWCGWSRASPKGYWARWPTSTWWLGRGRRAGAAAGGAGGGGPRSAATTNRGRVPPWRPRGGGGGAAAVPDRAAAGVEPPLSPQPGLHRPRADPDRAGRAAWTGRGHRGHPSPAGRWGVGKTALATEYAHRYRSQFDTV